MAIIAFMFHKRLSINTGLLTFDVQIPLARYEVRNENWYDSISDAIVVFPQHFHDLRSRVVRFWLPDPEEH